MRASRTRAECPLRVRSPEPGRVEAPIRQDYHRTGAPSPGGAQLPVEPLLFGLEPMWVQGPVIFEDDLLVVAGDFVADDVVELVRLASVRPAGRTGV